MKNTAAAAASAAKKRSISEGFAAEPPAKRPSRDVSAASQSCYNLTPELIGHIARFLGMGTPTVMHLLLCVGPRGAAVVRKMYLTENEYYLCTCMDGCAFDWFGEGRVKERIGYWMDYNEEAWKKRCLGKKHKENIHTVMLTPKEFRSFEIGTLLTRSTCIHTVMLTPKEFRSFEIGTLSGLNYVDFDEAALDEATANALMKLAKNTPLLFLISVGDKDVDDGHLMTEEECRSLVDSAPVNSDGKICIRFMRKNDVLFAYPRLVLRYDLVDALKFQIEEKIIEPEMTLPSVDDDGDLVEESLLYFALFMRSAKCFRYLLSLPGNNINAPAWSRDTDGFQHFENIIHSCLSDDDIPPSYVKGVIAHSNVDLDARDSSGRTAFFEGCIVDEMKDQTITKLRMLLEFGADPRIEDDDGERPLNVLEHQTMNAQEDQNDELKVKLESLKREIVECIAELNHLDGQNT